MTQAQITPTEGARYTRILSVGAARGDLTVPNADLIGPIDSSDEWIQQRTGIITRMRASQDILAVDLATDASLEAIKRSGINAADIDLVIVATISNTMPTPSMATLLAERIKASPAAAYDISAACAGYAYAIAQADALIKSGVSNYALVVGRRSCPTSSVLGGIKLKKLT